MENRTGVVKEDHYQMDLPPGFRFHPTDEELISHYLSNKVLDTNFCCRAIADVDLNKSEPWDLPWKAKMGEKEWYFFCMRDRKYPTGLRTNRATQSGYWKATGKDKEIFKGKTLVGMKKTLVFYGGRAPKGEKSNWVMHEFRLDGQISSFNLPNHSKNEWVISRVFQKSCGKRVHISDLPPLKDSSFSFNNNNKSVSESIHVPCFSNNMNSSSQRTLTRMADYYSPAIFPRNTQPTSLIYHPQAQTFSLPYLQFPSSVSVQDQAIVRGMIEKEKISVSQETGLSNDLNNEISSVVSNLDMGLKPFDDQEAPSASIGPLNPHNFWNY